MQNPKLRYFKPFEFFDHTGSTRMGNREVKVDTNEPKASQDTIKSIAEVVFGLTNFLGTAVWTKAEYDMWERGYEDERANVIPEGQIVQRASAMACEECAEYFELIRDSLRNILLDINKFVEQRDQRKR